MLREGEYLSQKQLIGKKAASYIQSGAVVILDSGTTVLQASKHLVQDRLTVMSNCLPILTALSSRRNINLMGTGGTFYWDNQCFIGPIAIKAIESINANVALMGTTGLSLSKGMTNRKFEEAEVKQAMIKAAEKIMLVMDSSKMNYYALATVGPIEVIDTLITDDGLLTEDKAAIEEHGVKVVIANNE
jgi:DeoR/GlpR family transcriptional regulator of sugar metabolism